MSLHFIISYSPPLTNFSGSDSLIDDLILLYTYFPSLILIIKLDNSDPGISIYHVLLAL